MLLSFFVLSVGFTMMRCDIADLYNTAGNLTAVTWDHAVNSKSLLATALSSNVMMIEADVEIGKIIGTNSTDTLPIMCHPNDAMTVCTSDLSLQTFLDNVLDYNNKNKAKVKGVKLDFKSINAFEKSILIINKTYNQANFPIWLNADILKGPVDAKAIPVDAKKFVEGSKNFTKSTLSLGWTTYFNDTFADKSYQAEHIDAMKKVIAENKVMQNITFPVRAGLAINNVDLMKKLVEINKNYTLTIWSGKDDKVDIEKLKKLILDVGLERTYIDLPENILQRLDLSDSGNSGTTTMITTGIFSVLVALGAYLISNNVFS